MGMAIPGRPPYRHVEHLGRADFEIAIDPDSASRPWAASMTIRGHVAAVSHLPVTDSEGQVARIGLRVRDAATLEILSEARGELARDADAAGGLAFAATLPGYGLRPRPSLLSAGLVIDPIAWYSHASDHMLALAPSPDFVDARALARELSVEQLCATADGYFARSRHDPWLRAKPFALWEAQTALPEFAFLLRGLRLREGMRVMDFGAGTGWASRWLRRLGLRVVSADVSATALEISASLAEPGPTLGEPHPIEYLRFNGRRFDLPDASIERVFCMAALHHVPNLAEVFAEFARITADGGRIGFAEPGPRHSLYHMSQHDMRTHRVLENDVNLAEIEAIARAVGFGPAEIMAQNALPNTVSLDRFARLADDAELRATIIQEIIERAKFSQVFFFDRLPR